MIEPKTEKVLLYSIQWGGVLKMEMKEFFKTIILNYGCEPGIEPSNFMEGYVLIHKDCLVGQPDFITDQHNTMQIVRIEDDCMSPAQDSGDVWQTAKQAVDLIHNPQYIACIHAIVDAVTEIAIKGGKSILFVGCEIHENVNGDHGKVGVYKIDTSSMQIEKCCVVNVQDTKRICSLRTSLSLGGEEGLKIEYTPKEFYTASGRENVSLRGDLVTKNLVFPDDWEIFNKFPNPTSVQSRLYGMNNIEFLYNNADSVLGVG